MLSLATDALDTHVEGVLQQLNVGSWHSTPKIFLLFKKKIFLLFTVYCSRSCQGRAPRTPPSTASCWPLSALSDISDSCWRGRQFRLLTDHKPLVTSLFRTTPPWSARQQRQLSFIAEFTSDFRHTPGQENVVADALSRPPPAAAQLPPPQPTSPALTIEDWPEEGLATPEKLIMAAIADAQLVDFRRCPLHSNPARRRRR
jgi:hypothetical protein